MDFFSKLSQFQKKKKLKLKIKQEKKIIEKKQS